MTTRALVLGAGGHAATAWQTGIIAGLAESGIDVRGADLFIGTSAGSIVSVQVASGVALEELFRRQVDRALQVDAPLPSVNFNEWRTSFLRAKEGPGGTTEVLRRFGALGMSTPATFAAQRRAAIAARLPIRDWPRQRLLAVAVDADSGERRAFDRDSGVDLLDAVVASCAVPGLWPLIAIGGRHYMDGGVHSIDNADLAAGCDRALVLTLRSRVPPICVVGLDAAVEALRARGTAADVIFPDERAEAAFASVGGNVLDPAVREAAARAGREQGRGPAALRIASGWMR